MGKRTKGSEICRFKFTSSGGIRFMFFFDGDWTLSIYGNIGKGDVVNVSQNNNNNNNYNSTNTCLMLVVHMAMA